MVSVNEKYLDFTLEKIVWYIDMVIKSFQSSYHSIYNVIFNASQL